MVILVDVGGSGVRIAQYDNRTIGSVQRFSVSSFQQFTDAIKKAADGKFINAILIGTAGYVTADHRTVVLSRAAPYLEGNLYKRLRDVFPYVLKIYIVNDGEAHARSLLYHADKRKIDFGAIHLSIGTSVGFGAIDENRNIIVPCDGKNMDIGDFMMETRASQKEVWYALGSQGLSELERQMGQGAYRHFGYRLGTLLVQLSFIFHPRTIGLSGGIITHHTPEIMEGIQVTFMDMTGKRGNVVMLSGDRTPFEGLTTLL